MKKQTFLLLTFIFIMSTLSVIVISKGGGGGSSPPPPPPPCQIQSSGCYKTGDVKADFGSLAPAEFSYFLPEDKCKRTDNCDCNNVPDNVAQQTDPDASSGACNCIARTDWNAQGKCCGDDTDDCAKIVSGSICSVGMSEQQSNWVSSSANVGDIRHLGCSGAEYLSDGTSWIKCDGTVWKNTVGNNEYFCIGRGRESIVECCGDGSCNSRIDGKRLTTGLSIRNPPVGTVISPPSGTQPPGQIPPTTQTVTIVKDIQAVQSSQEEDCAARFGAGWEKFAYAPIPHITFCKKLITISFMSGSSSAQVLTDIRSIANQPGGRNNDQDCMNTYGTEYHDGGYDGKSHVLLCKKVITLQYSPGTQSEQVIANTHGVWPTSSTPAGCTTFGAGWQSYIYDSASDITWCKVFTTIQSTPPSSTTTPPTTTAPILPNDQTPCQDSIIGTLGNPYKLCMTPRTNLQIGTSGSQQYSIRIHTIYNRDNTPQGMSTTLTIVAPDGSITEDLSSTTSNGGSIVSGAIRININNIVSVGGYYYVIATVTSSSGPTPPSSTTGASIVKLTGAQVVPLPPTNPTYNNVTSYCRSDGKFVTELDTPEPNRGDMTLNNKNRATCERAGFTWTGTKCCSEDDDNSSTNTLREFYNDAGGSGACWNSTYVRSVDFVGSSENSVISYQGAFHGCAVDRRNFNTNNDNLLSLIDKHTNTQLITNHDYCFNEPERNYFCSYTERWLPTDGADRTHLSYAPTPASGTVTCQDNTIGYAFGLPYTLCIGKTLLTAPLGSPHHKFKIPSISSDGTKISFRIEDHQGNLVRQWDNVAAGQTLEISIARIVINRIVQNAQDSFVVFTPVLTTSGTPNTLVSTTEIASGECCAQNECWNGVTCVSNQRNNPLSQLFNGHRCIDGNWVRSQLKFTPDGSRSGYCPADTKCLVNPLEQDETKQCIDSNQYIDDNYCENGNWSSRTKLLALKLLKMKSGDFTLFCDNRQNTLNNLQYLSESGEIVENVLTNLQTNNFCILKNNNRVIAAVSINRNLEDLPRNAINILGITNCNNALIDDNQYHSCDSTNKVWFNKRLKSFIYSSTPITVPSEENPFASLEEFISNPIRAVIDTIRRLITTPPFDDSYVNAIKKFDRMYMTQQGSKSIKGALEGTSFKNAVIGYTNFENDICNFVQQFNQGRSDVSSGIACGREGNNYYVLAQGSQLTNLDPESIWPDLTSKLRLR